MKRADRVLIGVVCLVLLLVSWVVAVSSKTTSDKQLELMRQAAMLVKDGIYIRAVPLLEEAAAYNAAHTQAAEEELKKVYLALIGNRGFKRKYTELLELQMSRKNAGPGVFAEAAEYYLSISRVPEALAVIKAGIGKTGSEDLIELYESNRYACEMSRTSYDYVAAIHGSTVQVQTDGLWGLAGANGVLLIPCVYEKISTFSGDRAVVLKNGEIYAIDINNNRVAKFHDKASGLGNYSENRIPVLVDGRWRRAMADLTLGTMEFERMGMYSGGYAAAKTGGAWGVIDLLADWLIPAEYDGIIQDELGKCFARGAVFVQSGDLVYLLVDGVWVGDAYDDARPFSQEGYAAVKKNGKWGFIDLSGIVTIGFRFDDALSFGQHLAAVRLGDFWGYVSISGQIVIEPVFLEAKSFSSGSAPVLTERGWQFISLLEYKKGASL